MFGTTHQKDAVPAHEVVIVPWRNTCTNVELQRSLPSQDGMTTCPSWLLSGTDIYPAVFHTLTWPCVDQICLQQDRQTAGNKSLISLQAHCRYPRTCWGPDENKILTANVIWRSPALQKCWPLLRGTWANSF